MNDPGKEKELTPFQLRNISILTHLLLHDAVTDEIVDSLRQSELDYFSLLEKYHLLEKNVNIDEKTNLLKFKPDYLTAILKTASRIYQGIKSRDYLISFVRFDIDDFSRFNNTYGHDVGDKILILIANIIREHSRPTDYVIRFGGEEFDVILPATDIAGASQYIDKLLDAVRAGYIDHQGQRLSATVSAGASSLVYTFGTEYHIEGSGIEKIFGLLQNEADNALYQAKYEGKNRYCIYDPAKKEDYINIRTLYTKK
ncbi:MAG: GGDEF domain-containing protein [Spirochaetota bacterium]